MIKKKAKKATKNPFLCESASTGETNKTNPIKLKLGYDEVQVTTLVEAPAFLFLSELPSAIFLPILIPYTTNKQHPLHPTIIDQKERKKTKNTNATAQQPITQPTPRQPITIKEIPTTTW